MEVIQTHVGLLRAVNFKCFHRPTRIDDPVHNQLLAKIHKFGVGFYGFASCPRVLRL